MSKRDKLMRQLSSVQFALWELHLYLDTHPSDLEAVSLHEQYEKKLMKLCEEYESAYGPLTPSKGEGVGWLSDPWPWDAERSDD